MVARVEKYRKANLEKYRVYSTRSKDKLKSEIFSTYGCGELKCKGCGESDLAVLTIDHINGGGNQHRKKIGCKTGCSFYRWLKKNGYPEGFQVLCFNCQFRKRSIEIKPENPNKRQQQKANYVRLVKEQVLARYGTHCTCGETDLEVLTLDHVNDDGAKHRKDTGTRGFNFYIMLRKNNFPQDPPLKVLCINCQYRKRNELYEEGKIRQTNDDNGATFIV